jgi:membrane-associated protease RseP (regulator of RpoE activity)
VGCTPPGSKRGQILRSVFFRASDRTLFRDSFQILPVCFVGPSAIEYELSSLLHVIEPCFCRGQPSLTREAAAGKSPNLAGTIQKIAERVILGCLFVYALAAPHSIAATQGAFLVGMVAWGVEAVATRRLGLRRTAFDFAILGFFTCCVISSFLSYAPVTSIKGLRSPAFFFAFYLVSNKVTTLRLARTLAMTLVASCVVNVAYSGWQLVRGRGVQIDSMQPDSPLRDGGFEPGDIILEVDRQPIETIDDLSRLVDSGRGRLTIVFQRTEAVSDTSISRRGITESPGVGAGRLGITTSRGRSLRVTGFFNHYETYAEVLQLIAALAIGMFLALPRKRSRFALLLGAAIVLITTALVMTSTRAAIAGLVVSTIVISVVSLGRRAALVAATALLVLIPAALLVVRHYRGVSFVDLEDGSTAYRIEVWQEALALVQKHPLFGIGKGSEGQETVRETFGLYANGKLPPGHFHSTPIQVATWWGLIALTFYFAAMAVLLAQCWKLYRLARARNHLESGGLALGVLGALIAFNVASLAHFNFGDGEVVMALWLVAGLAFAVKSIEAYPSAQEPRNTPSDPEANSSDRNRLLRPKATAELPGRAAAVTPSSGSR